MVRNDSHCIDGQSIDILVGQQGSSEAAAEVIPPLRGSLTFILRSGVEAIEGHDLVPGCDEVVDELLLGVGTSVDFGQGAELGV